MLKAASTRASRAARNARAAFAIVPLTAALLASASAQPVGATLALLNLLFLAASLFLAHPTRSSVVDRSRWRVPRSSIDLGLAALVAATAVQLVPLAPGVRSPLSPAADGVRVAVQFVAPATREAWHALSLLPQATGDAVLTLTASTLTFWAVRTLLSATSVRRLAHAVGGVGVAVAVWVVAQQWHVETAATTADTVARLGAHPFGPFVNRNHTAAWAMMALPLLFALLCVELRRLERHRAHVFSATRAPLPLVSVLGSATLLTAVLVLSLSRSAAVGAVVSIIALWRWARVRRDAHRMTSLTAIGSLTSGRLAIACGGVILLALAMLDADGLAARLQTTVQPGSAGRLTIWRESLPVVRDFWLTGVGAGSYSAAMLVYQQTRVPLAHLQLGGWAHFNQAHSHYVQVAAEGGLLLGMPLLVLAASGIRTARQALRHATGDDLWLRAGAAAGLVAVTVQSVWDTPLRMSGNAALAATLAAVLLHSRREFRSSEVREFGVQEFRS